MGLFGFWEARHRQRRFERALRDYAAQAERLQAHLDRTGVEAYVPPLEGETYEGRTWTWTSWTEGATHSLPKADVIGLTNAAEEQLLRLWNDVEAVCGPFTPDDALKPVRYRAQWPSPAAWTRLRCEYVAPNWGPDV